MGEYLGVVGSVDLLWPFVLVCAEVPVVQIPNNQNVTCHNVLEEGRQVGGFYYQAIQEDPMNLFIIFPINLFL